MELLKGVLDEMDQGVLVLDEDQRPVYWNARLNEIFRLTTPPPQKASQDKIAERIRRHLPDSTLLSKTIPASPKEPNPQEGWTTLTDGRKVKWMLSSLKSNGPRPLNIFKFEEAQADRKNQNEASAFKQVAENLGVGIWLRDQDDLVYTNPAIRKIFGVEDDQTPSLELFSSRMHPEDRQQVSDSFHSQDFRNKGMQKEIFRIITPGGERKWIESRVFPVYGENGEMIRIAGIDRDITRERETFIKLEETNETLQKIIQSSPDSIVITDLEGNITYCNKETAILFECQSKEELTGKNVFGLVFEEDRNLTHQHMLKVLEKGTVKNLGYRIRTYTNRLIHIEASVSTLNDSNGHPTSFIAISKDVHQRKKAERLLRENERKFRNIFNNANDALILITPHGYHLDNNQKALELTGYSQEEIEKLDITDVLVPERQENAQKIFNRLQKGERLDSSETEFLSKDRRRIPVELSVSPVYDHQGNINAFLSVVRDIRERKSFEQKLIKAKQRAEESDRLKSAFLANMSHEIRTPMNGIVGFTNLLKRNNLNESKKKRFIDIINNSALQLLGIINDIIDISKLETGQQKIQEETFNINQMMREIHTLYQEQARNKNLQLRLHNGLTDATSDITTDRIKLQQILYNLINNALKFTTKGKISLGYESRDRKLCFYVADTGPGIPEDMKEKIFERFMQVLGSDTQFKGGTGLGLSISKGLVELLGGEISVRSKVGEGTTFYFNIPHTGSRKEDSHKENLSLDPAGEEEASKTILLVEDNPDHALYMKEIIKKLSIPGHHFRIIHLTHGHEAIRFCNNREVDMVLMDLGLPDINGATAIQSILKYKPELPVIAQSAYMNAGGREQMLEAGFTDYIPKPLSPNRVKRTITRVLCQNQRQ